MKNNKLTLLINEASLALLQGKEGEANALLSQVFDELLTEAKNLPPAAIVRLTKIMEIMHQAQQRRDYVYLVDILKYEVLSII